MAQQGTGEQTSSDQQSAEEEAGRHRAPEEGAGDQEASSSASSSETSEQADQKSTPAEASEKATSDDAPTEKKSAPADGSAEKKSTSDDASSEKQSAPANAPTEKKSAPADAPTEKKSAPADAPTEKHQRGAADTSWAEPEAAPRRHVDVGEIAWRAGKVVATVLRTLALLFALVLIVNVVLVLVGVNPANGVAQFIGGLASLVILGFRDLFVPADPTIALIVNSLVAAVFWVFVGELVSRLIRFVAARVR